MDKTFIDWLQNLSPWLLSHGIKITIIIIGALILNKIILKLINRIVQFAVIVDERASKEAEKKKIH
ncbi:MAG: hypothetical protein IPL98_08145 [Saprospiraceae bacterium]|nr:hypothetical protein [Saprospiraceae bacterium]